MNPFWLPGNEASCCGPPSINQSTRLRSGCSLSSAQDSGHSERISIRPANESATLGSNSTLADPVSRKRPGLRCRSTAALMARKRAGARCTSSITTGPFRPCTNPAGSPRAAASVALSSSVR